MENVKKRGRPFKTVEVDTNPSGRIPMEKEFKESQKPKVELVSYAIKMTIPTGQYANIQPEIVVRAGNLDDAHAYCAGHMNKLWKEYFLINERRPEPKKEDNPSETVPPAAKQSITPPASSVSLLKATQAIKSCLSLDALELISNQVEKSVKLTNEDKAQLMPLLEDKYNELKLNGKQTNPTETTPVVEQS